MKFPHVGAIERMGSAVDGKYTYASAGSTKCFLQPIDATSAELYALTYTKGSVGYFPIDADVREKDRVVIDGTTYGVRGIKKHNYGRLAHLKVVLEQI